MPADRREAASRALVDRDAFRGRALTRNPETDSGSADEALEADLNQSETLEASFAGAYGVFVVSNLWKPGSDEVAQGRAAVESGRKVGVCTSCGRLCVTSRASAVASSRWRTSPAIRTMTGRI